MKNRDIENAAFAFSKNMLKRLLSMSLITEEEYNQILTIAEEHYDTGFYCV